MGDISVHMRVTTSFGEASLDGLNVSKADLQKRRGGATGTVDSAIADTDGQGFWVVLDDEIPKREMRASRQMQAQENPAIQESISRRVRRAPYWAHELKVL